MDDLAEERKQNGKTRILKTPIKLSRPTCVHRSAVGTSVALYPDSLGPAFKISLHIAVTPETTALTSWALLRPWPTKIFAFFNQPLYIYRKMKYQCFAFCGWSVGIS
jgi:hypothetical protein